MKQITITLQNQEAIDIVEAIPPEKLDLTLEDYILIAGRILRGVRVSERDALSDIFQRLDGFESTFQQVLGELGKSQRRGALGEADVLADLNLVYGREALFTHVGQEGHAGDIAAHLLQTDTRLLIEVKNYGSSVPTSEVNKFWRDMIDNDYRYGIFISLRSPIQSINDSFAYQQDGQRRAVFVVNNSLEDRGHRLAFEYVRRLIELDRLGLLSGAGPELAAKMSQVRGQLGVIRDNLNLAADIHKTAAASAETVNQNMAHIRSRVTELQARMRTALETIDRTLLSISDSQAQVNGRPPAWFDLVDQMAGHRMVEPFRFMCAELAGYGLELEPETENTHRIIKDGQVVGMLDIAGSRIQLLTARAVEDDGQIGWKAAPKKSTYQWKRDIKNTQEARTITRLIARQLVG